MRRLRIDCQGSESWKLFTLFVIDHHIQLVRELCARFQPINRFGMPESDLRPISRSSLTYGLPTIGARVSVAAVVRRGAASIGKDNAAELP